jgi:hypothetical protein
MRSIHVEEKRHSRFSCHLHSGLCAKEELRLKELLRLGAEVSERLTAMEAFMEADIVRLTFKLELESVRMAMGRRGETVLVLKVAFRLLVLPGVLVVVAAVLVLALGLAAVVLVVVVAADVESRGEPSEAERQAATLAWDCWGGCLVSLAAAGDAVETCSSLRCSAVNLRI